MPDEIKLLAIKNEGAMGRDVFLIYLNAGYQQANMGSFLNTCTYNCKC